MGVSDRMFYYGGLATIIVGYVIGAVAVSLFGVLPAVEGFWSWNEHGLSLLLGFVGALLLCALGTWLRNKAKKNKE